MKMAWMLKAAASALALSPTVAVAQARGAAVAPLNYKSRVLANGLKVYSIRDPKSANVSVQVWYEVGSRDDPRGRSGFAHLFEHMMFKASRNLAPEQFDRLTEDVGGFNNASTNDDYTNYYEVVPANHLQRLLWAEADRMRSLVIEPGFFNSERDVVKEELRSRVLAQPYGKLFYLYFPQISYDVDPYARPGIGSIEDLDAATIEDVRAFHATYYRPDNAVLVVSGNFDQAQFDQWVDGYFGGIAVEDHRLRQGGGLAVHRLTLAKSVRQQLVLGFGQFRCADRLVAQPRDFLAKRGLAGLGALAPAEDRIDGEIAASLLRIEERARLAGELVAVDQRLVEP